MKVIQEINTVRNFMELEVETIRKIEIRNTR